MDFSAVLILLLVAAGVGGFAVLARALMSNWRIGSMEEDGAGSVQSKRSREFEECYNSCMGTEHWDPDSVGACVSRCRYFPAL
jgi:hypothetical protein